MKAFKQWNICLVALLALAVSVTTPVTAQEFDATGADMRSQSLHVPLYKSRLMALNAPATRSSVGNPDVADILILRATQ